MGVDPNGSQNELVDVQMPASGEKLYPQFGRAAAVVLPAQSGYGVVVEGTGCEVVETGALEVERTKLADDAVATDPSGLTSSQTFTINVSDVAELLRIGTTASDWGNGSLTLIRSGSTIRVRRTDALSTEFRSVDVSAIAGIEITGRDGANDELVIDFTGGSPLTGVMTFVGDYDDQCGCVFFDQH